MSMFVALDPYGHLITIENAMRGLACNCTCACCGEPVVARKGLIREHHFSHHSNKESCFIQRESLLHLYAKEVIRNQLGLQLPPLPDSWPGSEDKTSWWDFERVDEEVPQQGFQPDLVAYLKDGSQLFIEVAVTSFIGEEKGAELLVATTSSIAEVELTTEKKSGEKVVEVLILDEFMDVKGWKVLGNRLSQDKVKKLVLKSAKVGEAPVVEAKTIASEYIDMDGGDEDMGDSGDEGDEGTSDQGGGTVILGGDGSPQLNLL